MEENLRMELSVSIVCFELWALLFAFDYLTFGASEDFGYLDFVYFGFGMGFDLDNCSDRCFDCLTLNVWYFAFVFGRLE